MCGSSAGEGWLGPNGARIMQSLSKPSPSSLELFFSHLNMSGKKMGSQSPLSKVYTREGGEIVSRSSPGEGGRAWSPEVAK